MRFEVGGWFSRYGVSHACKSQRRLPRPITRNVFLMKHLLTYFGLPVHSRRYMKLLSVGIASSLPYRFFKVHGTSEALLDRVRSSDGDMQVQIETIQQPSCIFVGGGCIVEGHIVFAVPSHLL